MGEGPQRGEAEAQSPEMSCGYHGQESAATHRGCRAEGVARLGDRSDTGVRKTGAMSRAQLFSIGSLVDVPHPLRVTRSRVGVNDSSVGTHMRPWRTSKPQCPVKQAHEPAAREPGLEPQACRCLHMDGATRAVEPPER